MQDFYRIFDNYWEDYNVNNKLAEWKILNTSINLENFHDTEFYATDPYFYQMSLNDNYDNSEKKIFTIYAEREYNYYLIKILIPIVLILIVCWSVFWINIVQIESRLTISVVCLLALIAYNVIVAEALPKIGYATVMDYIILSSYILGALSTLLTVIFYNFHIRQYNVMGVEKFTRVSLPILYGMIVYIIIDYNIERLDSRAIGQFILGMLNF